jgi:hypothetical protein
MKRTALSIAIMLSCALSSPAFSCNVCHSKNPKMVRMHEALQFKDCFTCHKPGSLKTGAELKGQMTSDPRCVTCHKK